MVVQFNNFIPLLWVDLAATAVVLIVILSTSYKLRIWLRVVPSTLFRDARMHVGSSSMVGLFFSELGNRVLAQKKILNDSRTRRAVHLMMFWGFVGLGFATIWDDIFYRNGILPSPSSFSNFGNIIGNIAGVALLIGLTIVVLRYMFIEKFRMSYKGDFFFLAFLYLATATGFATEFSRFTIVRLADMIYLLHLYFIGGLFISAPFTHFFHALLMPILRYIEAIEKKLVAKQINTYPFYRRNLMAELAENVKSNNLASTSPTWLGTQKDQEYKTNSHEGN